MNTLAKAVVFLTGSVLAAAVIGSVADAGPTVGPVQPGHVYRPGLVPNCATGFSETGASGNPAAAHSFRCVTPVLHCPPGAQGFITGMGGVAQQQGAGWQFSYSCRYDYPPQ